MFRTTRFNGRSEYEYRPSDGGATDAFVEESGLDLIKGRRRRAREKRRILFGVEWIFGRQRQLQGPRANGAPGGAAFLPVACVFGTTELKPA